MLSWAIISCMRATNVKKVSLEATEPTCLPFLNVLS